jgi:hypothetical protein
VRHGSSVHIGRRLLRGQRRIVLPALACHRPAALRPRPGSMLRCHTLLALRELGHAQYLDGQLTRPDELKSCGGYVLAPPSQKAVMAALMKVAAVPRSTPPAPGVPQPAAAPLPAPSSAAAQRFAALPPAVRHDCLVKHLAALQAGRITLAQLP